VFPSNGIITEPDWSETKGEESQEKKGRGRGRGGIDLACTTLGFTASTRGSTTISRKENGRGGRNTPKKGGEGGEEEASYNALHVILPSLSYGRGEKNKGKEGRKEGGWLLCHQRRNYAGNYFDRRIPLVERKGRKIGEKGEGGAAPVFSRLCPGSSALLYTLVPKQMKKKKNQGKKEGGQQRASPLPAAAPSAIFAELSERGQGGGKKESSSRKKKGERRLDAFVRHQYARGEETQRRRKIRPDHHFPSLAAKGKKGTKERGPSVYFLVSFG